MMERHMHGHDVSSPLLAEPGAGDTCAVEALQRADEPDLVLIADAGRVAGEGFPLRRRSVRHVCDYTSIDVSVRSYAFTQVKRCLLWPHGMGKPC
jgi:hypothetical protein